MPRNVRNPGSGKPPYNGPAAGEGWGGPAKGAGTGGPAQPRTAEDSQRSGQIAGDRELKAERKILAATKEERLEQMRQVWGNIALNGTAEMAQIIAADKLYDRLAGRPVAMNLHARAPSARMPFDLDALTEEQIEVLNDVLLLGTDKPGEAIEGEVDDEAT